MIDKSKVLSFHPADKPSHKKARPKKRLLIPVPGHESPPLSPEYEQEALAVLEKAIEYRSKNPLKAD